MKITMDGKYAYRVEPRVQVRVLCIDASGERPVISMNKRGTVHYHYANGQWLGDCETATDLVPLDESLVVTPGVYERRNGETAHVVYVRKDACEYPFIGYFEETNDAALWNSEGGYITGCEGDHDLIRRIGDLP